jgi:Ca2+-binding RTX toxin-like protein
MLRKSFTRARKSSGRVRSKSARPVVCQLEDRLVPTVSFTPVFGNFTADTSTSHNGAVLNSPDVVLIFEGSYWTAPTANPPTSITLQDVFDAVNHIIASPYTDPLSQYGSFGRTTASVFHTETDLSITTNAAGAQGFREGSLIKIDAGTLSAAADSWMTLADVISPRSDHSLYFVITPPGVQDFDASGVWGYHKSRFHSEVDFDGTTQKAAVPFGWLGINVDGTVKTRDGQIDDFSRTFSHELVEARTDPYINNPPDANRYAQGANWNDPSDPVDEIADFEPDGRRYTYRLLSGTVVQPYWSNTINAFVVADGNNQTVTVNPLWTVNSAGQPMSPFLKQFDVVINGDQIVSNAQNDSITIDITRGGGTLVKENGESFQFDPGQIRNLTVNTGTGNDTVTIDALPEDVNLTINLGGQSGDTVRINPLTGNAGTVGGSVTIVGGSGNGTLEIDDHNPPPYRQPDYEIQPGAVVRHDHYDSATIDVPIYYQGLGEVALSVGSTAKQVAVDPGSFTSSMKIRIAGTGNTSIVANDATGSDLEVVYSLDSDYITRTAPLTGVAVMIQYQTVKDITINGPLNTGTLASTFNVTSTFDTPITLHARATLNTFNLGDGTSTLDSILAAPLTLVGNGRRNNLVLDDRGATPDPTGTFTHTIKFDLASTATGGSVVRKNDKNQPKPFGPITFTNEETFNYSGIQDVSIFGSAIGSTFNLQGFEPGIALDHLVIHGNLAADSLVLDDSATGQPANYTIGHADLLRTTPTTSEDLKFTDIENVQVKAAGGGNVFTIDESVGGSTAPMSIALPGTGANTIYVNATSAPLTINSLSPDNLIFIGGSGNGNLGSIAGAVTLTGLANAVTINDSATTAPMTYVMDATHFSRTSTPAAASIFFGGLSASVFNVALGTGGNDVTINGTPALSGAANSSINLATGSGSDSVHLFGASAPLAIDLGMGLYQPITLGDSSHSLDAIRGAVNVTGSGFMETFISNAASTTSQTIYMNAQSGNTLAAGGVETVQRTQFNVDHYDPLNLFTFRFKSPGRVNYSAGQGGDTTFVGGTLANVPVVLTGGPSTDVFWVEGDQSPLLSPVNVNGNASQNDFAYYYDWYNTTPQTYTYRALPSQPLSAPNTLDLQIVERPGAAAVTYHGMAELVTYGARVGGSTIYVQGVPTGEFLNMVAADHDAFIVGNVAPEAGGKLGINGDMSKVLGAIDISYGPNVALALDDSGDAAGRNVVLHPRVDAYGDFITGMAPAAIYTRLDASSRVTLYGGKGNDSFAMAGANFSSPIQIDGGGGGNLLDYSNVAGLTAPSGVYVNLVLGTATGLTGGIRRIANVTGSSFNDILVGNGGNVLNGGAGRDILIAGADASTLIGGTGDDLLIGGTTAYDRNSDMLAQLMAKWASAALYKSRVTDVANFLRGAITKNGGHNTLLGQSDLDLFFGRNNDNSDDANDEQFIKI